MTFVSGNAADDGAPFHSWFVGDLKAWTKPGGPAVGQDPGLRTSSTVEMKWGHHRKGDQRREWAGCSDKITMSVLVRGKFRLRFRSPADGSKVIERLLEREGDYAIWGTDVEHIWIVEEEAIIFTVRWKEK